MSFMSFTVIPGSCVSSGIGRGAGYQFLQAWMMSSRRPDAMH